MKSGRRRRLRPSFFALVLMSAVAGDTAPAWFSSRAASAQPTQAPNFVVILTDDQRWDTIGRCVNGFDGEDLNAGTASCMPKLQEHLVANGMTFKRGYVTTSLCCPSRASILTGNYSRHTGVVSNFGFPQFDDSSTLATWLDGEGYRTALVGKYLNGYGEACCEVPANYVPPGWDAWHSFWGVPGYTSYSMVHKPEDGAVHTVSYSGTAAAPTPCAAGVIYSTDHLCRRALDFLAADVANPFFLFFTPFSPHAVEAPASRWSHIYMPTNQPVTLPTYPNHNAIPSPNPPSWLSPSPLSSTRLSSIAAGFRRSLRTNRAVDDAVEALVQQLSSDGRLSNTVFFFLSDNGLGRGEHRHDTKACEYEECHRVPFVVMCPPDVCPGAVAGQVNDHEFALNIDLAPTIADLAGITVPERVDGRSLVPILNNSADQWRTSFLLEETGMVSRNRPVGIVSIESDRHTYKYVKFLRSSWQKEMYDLTEDPWELANLADDGVHTDIQNRLAAALDQALQAPTVSMTQGPSGPVAQSDVTFEWTADESVTFECVLDSSDPQPCGEGTSGSKTYRELALADHAFVIRAIDVDNNESSLQQTFTVTADTTPPPSPAFVETPPDPSVQEVSFVFEDDEEAAVFACSLDDGAFTACTSPHSAESLLHGKHTFAVKAIDPSGNESTPASFTWNVVDTTSPPAPVLESLPADPSDPAVSFAFTSGEQGVTFSCTLDGTLPLPCTSPHTYDPLSEGTHTFEVGSVDPGGNLSPLTSHVWTVDDTPAAPHITETPGSLSRANVTFSFEASSGLATECSLDTDAFVACSSPTSYNGLSQGGHSFRVRTSSSGDMSGSDSFSWIVDSVAPAAPVLDSTPRTPSQGAVTFLFSTVEDDIRFACSLDGWEWSECTSPVNYVALATGSHTFRVTASDAAGNVSDVTTFDWEVDATPPAAPLLDAAPPTLTRDTVALFNWETDETGLDFFCSLDGAENRVCSPPVTYDHLSGGPHSFAVFARDAAGNASHTTPHTWTVDIQEPVVSLVGGLGDALVGQTTYPLNWTGSDDTGISRYEVYERTGTEGIRSLVDTTQTTSYRKIGSQGATYCHEVVARDGVERTGPSGERCRGVTLDDHASAITYTGPVTRTSETGSFDSTLTILDGVGQDLRYAFDGRRFGILARRTPGSGQADIFLDGVFLARVDLYADSDRNRVFVYQAAVPDGPHTLHLLWTGTRNASSSGTALNIDGIATISRN